MYRLAALCFCLLTSAWQLSSHPAEDRCQHFLDQMNKAWAEQDMPWLADHSALPAPDCPPAQAANFHLIRGDYLNLRGDAKAHFHYDQLIETATYSAYYHQRGYLGKADVSWRKGDLAQAQRYLSQARSIPADSALTELQFRDVLVSSVILSKLQQSDSALTSLLRMADLSVEPGGTLAMLQARVWIQIGRLYFIQFQTDLASDYLRRAEAWQRNHLSDEHTDLGQTYYHMGNVAMRRKDFTEAIRYYNAAGRIFIAKLGPQHARMADINNNLGLVHWRQGAYPSAISHFQQAIDLYAQYYGPQSMRIAGTQSNLGLLYQAAGQNKAALQAFQQALRIQLSQAHPNPSAIAGLYNNLGISYMTYGPLDQAAPMFEQALQTAQASLPPHHPYLARMASNKARSLSKLGRYSLALSAHQAALRYLVPGFAGPGNPDPSVGPMNGELIECLRHKAQTQALAATPGDTAQLDETLRTLSLAMRLVDSMRLGFRETETKIAYLPRGRYVYESLLEVAYRRLQTSPDPWVEALVWETLEKSRALVLLESLQDQDALDWVGIPADIKRREAFLRDTLLQLEQALNETADSIPIEAARFKLQIQKRDFIDSLEQQFPTYHDAKFDLNILSIPALQSYLGQQDHGWISYFVGESDIYAMVLTASESHFLHLGKTAPVMEQVHTLMPTLRKPPLELGTQADSIISFESTAESLFELLVRPVIKQLARTPRRWLLVPDGALAYIPFEALLTAPVALPGRYKSYPYWGQEAPISYAHSATMLLKLTQRKSTPNEELLVIAPSLGAQGPGETRGRKQAQLPYGLQEAAYLHEHYQGQRWHADALSVADFRREAGRFRSLHLSTHAQVDGMDPLAGSFIELGPEGRMPLLEVLQLRLDAEMVVLSACETAVGPLLAGEGVLSLARGFFVAGARSLLSTRWSVNDAATASIMIAYYDRLHQGLDKPEALHRAQQQWIEQTDHLMAHPYFWAGFSLLGKTDPLILQPARPATRGWLLLLLLPFAGLIGWWIQRQRSPSK